MLLKNRIKKILSGSELQPHSKIASKLNKDKSLVSGYLQAMADYGDIELLEIGKSKVYRLKDESLKRD
jgi:predicted transcriptional regulator